MAGSNLLRLAKKALFSTGAQSAKLGRKESIRNSSSKVLEHLKSRTLIRVEGAEATDFLQGLITNDMHHFEEGAAAIFALFLNIKGRVMCESIIYKTLEKSIYYVECDAGIAETLQKHLKMYKIRRKVDIQPSGMKIWSTFDANVESDGGATGDSNERPLEGQIFPCGTLSNGASKLVDDVMIYEDPRIPETSLRILTTADLPRDEIVRHLNFDLAGNAGNLNYRSFRYKLGIAEGVDDLPPGKALPLEINCDYLHGVSFHKGCYIGQELTARTHHTGVVRKRVMPVIIENGADKRFPWDESIVNEAGKAVGKFRGSEGQFGIGLMRITEALSAQSLRIADVGLKVVKPRWWPKEPQKDKATADSGK